MHFPEVPVSLSRVQEIAPASAGNNALPLLHEYKARLEACSNALGLVAVFNTSAANPEKGFLGWVNFGGSEHVVLEVSVDTSRPSCPDSATYIHDGIVTKSDSFSR